MDKNLSSGTKPIGILSKIFGEVGFFCEQSFKWGEVKMDESRQDEAKREERRRLEAERRLLEEVRLARQAGVDVKSVIGRDESRQIGPSA